MDYVCRCRRVDDREAQSYGMAVHAESVEQAREILARHLPTHWEDGSEMPPIDQWHIGTAGEMFAEVVDEFRRAEYQPTVGGQVSSYTPPAEDVMSAQV